MTDIFLDKQDLKSVLRPGGKIKTQKTSNYSSMAVGANINQFLRSHKNDNFKSFCML